MSHRIELRRTTAPRPRPEESALGFGHFFTDHMFMVEYEAGRGWHSARVVPYENLSLDPA